jgi:hypothetical protein
MVSPHVKSAHVSLLTALIVVGLTNYLFWQPQLELMRQEARSDQLRIYVIRVSDGWNVTDTTPCAIVHLRSEFDFEVTNTNHAPVQTLQAKFQATNWNGYVTENVSRVLGPGESFPLTYYWGTPDDISAGSQAQFTVSVISVQLPVQTTTFCVAYQ